MKPINPLVIIVVRGGNIEQAYTNQEVAVVVIDWDKINSGEQAYVEDSKLLRELHPEAWYEILRIQ
jgi:hypothetical protein